jgi:UDPglucose 6-dehydrogenase
MNVVVVGSGYVGLVTAAGLSSVGHRVSVVDVDAAKVDAIASGTVPFHEPGLEEMVRAGLATGCLAPTTDLAGPVAAADVVMIAVGTPPEASGRADLTYVFAAVKSIASALAGPCTVVVKSTVPVGTSDAVEVALLASISDPLVAASVHVVSNPEFLREGTAVRDFLEPDRVVVGSEDAGATDTMRDLYRPFGWPDDTIVVVGRRSSELSKYAANAMLATRISFMNEMARLADSCGADIEEVREVVGRDPRIGHRYLMAGAGFGGSCFPKDLAALVALGEDSGLPMDVARAVVDVNAGQIDVVLGKLLDFVGELRGKRIGVLGVAFKPDTDDVRDAPSLRLVREIVARGGSVVAADPVVRWVPMYSSMPESSFRIVADPYAMAEGTDAVVLMTEWEEYRHLDLHRLMSAARSRAIVDSRNLWRIAQVPADVAYTGVGRAAPAHGRIRSAAVPA